MDTDKLIHPELSEAIIGAAMKVLNTLKPGLNEKAYEKAPGDPPEFQACRPPVEASRGLIHPYLSV